MTLEQRLVRLERENRWMRRIGAVGIAAVAIVMFVGQADEQQPGNLRVRSLALVDEAGKQRASLRLQEGGVVALTLVGNDGGAGFEVCASPRGATTLTCYGANGDPPHVSLGFDNRVASLRLWNLKGSCGAELIADADTPRLSLVDDKRHMTFQYMNGPAGSGPPGVAIADGGGRGRIVFGAGPQGANLALADGSGKAIWKVPRE
jgi:hypothetical protein